MIPENILDFITLLTELLQSVEFGILFTFFNVLFGILGIGF